MRTVNSVWLYGCGGSLQQSKQMVRIMKTKYHIITVAILIVFWSITLAIPEQFRNVIYGLIAGWQVGTWTQQWVQNLQAKDAAKNILKRF